MIDPSANNIPAGQISLERIEIIVTYRCNSNCAHCLIQPQQRSVPDMTPEMGRQMVVNIATMAHPTSIMTFGGEPSLNLPTTLQIHQTAKEYGIPHRQLLTNGVWIPHQIFRSHPKQAKAEIQAIAQKLADHGVNDVKISMDEFHQQELGIDQQILAYNALNEGNIRVTFSPRWLSADQSHPMDLRTKEILTSLSQQGYRCEKGELIQPRGNALLNYPHEFQPIQIDTLQDVPCSRLNNPQGICISPTGEIILCENIIIGQISPEHPEKIRNILETMEDQQNKDVKILREKGVKALEQFVIQQKKASIEGKFYSICHYCAHLRHVLQISQTCDLDQM